VPRPFSFTFETNSSTEQILSAFGQEDYWRARLGAFDTLDTLEEFTVDRAGSVLVKLAKDVLHPGRQSGGPPIGRFLPRTWRVVQTEEWRAGRAGRIEGDLRLVAHGTPASAAGSTVIVPVQGGSQGTGSATVRFNVPLIGGQVENLMGRTLTESIRALNEFTTSWIAEHV